MLFKFGKLPAKRSMKMAALSSHMNMKTVSYPKVRAWERPIVLGILANDQIGDCTVAAMYHLRMTQRSVAQAAKPLIVTEAEAKADYSAITGWDGTDATDNGANCLDVINWYKKQGVILGASTIDIQNIEMVKAAINTFGCAYAGFTVPQSMVDQLNSGTDPDWSFNSADQPTQEGHCVNLVGYGADGVALDSWGKVYRTGWEFVQQWFTELYAIASPDWIEANKESPTGLDMPGLLAALPQS
jgi:hypothetical protein